MQANQSFDKALKTLGCRDRSCVIRKLCAGNDLEAAMANHFTPQEDNALRSINRDAVPNFHTTRCIQPFRFSRARIAKIQRVTMKAFLVCALLATVVATSFAHHLELCKKQDGELKTELQCIGLHISAEANQSFNTAVKTLGCKDWSCVIRKLCVGNDLANESFDAAQEALDCEDKSCVIRKLCEEGDLPDQILEIHNAATACDPDAKDEEEH
ncbi:hypothetical protein HPB50_001809 [Hyalomma asiaticum]|uniref:Uncharacterized protein n=1 Tax=Hyalomma asiaticum TaxID=266040 RepID=A0ACB7TAJ0_HYAAI|nr:hypothetical protein HPB50_001809 [Hyalomma asiaticum]